MQLRIQNSEKKKLIEEESHVRQIEMKFLDKESSRQYSQVMEEIMKTNLRKESHRSMPRSKSKSSANDFHSDHPQTSQFQTHIPSNQKPTNQSKPSNQKVEIKSQDKTVEEPVKKVLYKFSFKSLLIELIVAYAVTFALLYFIRLADFPYFQLILVVALTVAVRPWRSSNLLMLVGIAIVFGNYFLKLSYFTYPSLAICFYSVLVFNQKHKKKQLFVVVALFTVIYGFIILRAIARGLFDQGKLSTYTYIFPLLMLIIRAVISYSYWVIDRTAIIFLQLPLFVTGLEYGAILSFSTSTIEFWYLLVTFSLQIINDRTQFLLSILVSVTESCWSQEDKIKQKQNSRPYAILPAHSNGYSCIHSFHLFILVYIYSGLNLYTAPYSQADPIDIYTSPGYKPVIVWLLSSVYQIMSILLSKHKKNLLFFGFTSNKWWKSVLRGFVLVLGMWAYYLGLGIGMLTFSLHS